MPRRQIPMTKADYDRQERAREITEDYKRGRRWSNEPRPSEVKSHPAYIEYLEELLAARGDELPDDERRRIEVRIALADEHAPEIVDVGLDERSPSPTARAYVARCACGWEARSSSRLNHDDPMPEGYAWAAHGDHVDRLVREAAPW